MLVLDWPGWHASYTVVVPQHVHLLFLPARSLELRPGEHLWQFSDAPLVNRHFRDVDELEAVQLARCAALQARHDLVRSATLFSWWSKRIRKLQAHERRCYNERIKLFGQLGAEASPEMAGGAETEPGPRRRQAVGRGHGTCCACWLVQVTSAQRPLAPPARGGLWTRSAGARQNPR